MDRKHFFDAIRASIFGGSLSGSQVKGIEAILDACGAYQVADQRDVAYILATPMIETGGSFVPIVESLNYKASVLVPKFGSRITQAQANKYGRNDATGQKADQQAIANIIYGGTWGAQNLGNTQANDGWAYRGRSFVQVTGRNNYAKFSKVLGVDLLGNPDLACNDDIAAKIIVIGMRDGLFTGKKLRDYFTPTSSDWVNARRIVNGLDRANDIAAYGKKFYSALQDAA